jgi:hypothetical protein
MEGNCYEGRGISPDQEYIKAGTDEEQLSFAFDLALARSGL